MRAGDNASAPSHFGLSDPRARPVPDSTGHVQEMMVASTTPAGLPQHGQGPLYHPHSSLDRDEQCRHEGCSSRIQHGRLCQQHTPSNVQRPHQSHEKSQIAQVEHGVPLPARSMAIDANHQPPATNGTHNPSVRTATLSSASPSAQSKKTLPDKMVARKSVNHLPLDGRRGVQGSSKDTWTGSEARPPKRQRTATDDPEHIIVLTATEPDPALCAPMMSDGAWPTNGVPGKSPNTTPMGNAILQNPRSADSPATASPGWRPQKPNGVGQEYTIGHSRPAAHARPANGNTHTYHIGRNSPPMVPSQAYLLTNGHHKGTHQSREQHAQGIARVPNMDQSDSALARLVKFKQNDPNPAEVKEMMRAAKMRQLPRSQSVPHPSANGDVRPQVSSPGPVPLGKNRNLEPKPVQALPLLPAWRPPMPSMNRAQGWGPGMPAADPARAGGDAGVANTGGQAAAGSVSPQTSGLPTAPSNANGRTKASDSPSIRTNGVTAKESSQRHGTLQNSPKKVTSNNLAESTTTRPNLLEMPLGESTRGHEHGRKGGGVTAQPLSGLVPGSHRNHISIMHRADDEAKARQRRRERMLESAKRAEDALRQSTARMLPTATVELGEATQQPLNGTVPNGHQDDPMPDALESSPIQDSAKLAVVLPLPEQRRLELVSQHNSDHMDGFIYGELNAPCRPTSHLFHIVPEGHPPRTTRPAQNFAHIDPRIHWNQPRSRGWYAATQANIRDRGNRKKGFGQAAARQAKRKHDDNTEVKLIDEAGAKRQTLPPERVVADPLWLAAAKELDCMAAHYHADEKAKASGAAPRPRRPRISKTAKGVLSNGDGPTTRRSERHSAHQHDVGVASPAQSEKATKTTPARRILRTKTAIRPAATVEDADESDSDDNYEDSTYGEGSGHGLRRRGASRDDHMRTDADTTPTRTRSGR